LPPARHLRGIKRKSADDVGRQLAFLLGFQRLEQRDDFRQQIETLVFHQQPRQVVTLRQPSLSPQTASTTSATRAAGIDGLLTRS
jgi:hypothetical protein